MNLRKENGITLIALVITIIVLLILAGVAISMLSGENSVINKTNSAKTETDISSEEESVKLAVMSALATGNGEIVSEDAFKILRDELKKAGCKNFDEITSLPKVAKMKYKSYLLDNKGNITIIQSISEVKGKVLSASEKSKVVDESGNIIVIPATFKITEDSAIKTSDGIVVKAPDGSEFVWVPVEDINSMVMCQGSTGDNDCNITLLEDELVCSKHIGEDICGKLYSELDGYNFDSTITSHVFNASNELKEPAVLADETSGDYVTGNSSRGIALLKALVKLTGTDDEIKDKWEKQLKEDYEEMAKSVYENKGFYVGRYETSINSTSKVAQSKANVESASADNAYTKTWYGLYQKEKEYSQIEYESGKKLENIVGSTMIWGSQYDQMLIWIESNGYNVNSKDSAQLKNATRNTNGTITGIEKKDVLNNIYDLLGCRMEWTLEGCLNYRRIGRGGTAELSSAPSRRYYGDNVSSTNYVYSSRIALHIK